MKNKLQKNTITKNQLLQNNTQLIRVLDMEADRVFVIDCIKKTMPVWKDIESIKVIQKTVKGVHSYHNVQSQKIKKR